MENWEWVTNITKSENGIPAKGWRPEEEEIVVRLALNKKLSFEGWDQNWKGVTELKVCSISSIWVAQQELNFAARFHTESGFRESV
jgi:hypothetical protein